MSKSKRERDQAHAEAHAKCQCFCMDITLSAWTSRDVTPPVASRVVASTHTRLALRDDLSKL